MRRRRSPPGSGAAGLLTAAASPPPPRPAAGVPGRPPAEPGREEMPGRGRSAGCCRGPATGASRVFFVYSFVFNTPPVISALFL